MSPTTRTPIDRPPSREFLGLRFDLLTFDQTLAALAERSPEGAFGYVVTPNVDHLVRLDALRVEAAPDADQIRAAYANATLLLCDSRILQKVARWRGVALTLVPGSDLTARLFGQVIEPGDRIGIVGGDDTLLTALHSRYPGVAFVQHRPPMGLRRKPDALAAAAEFTARCGGRFVFLAVGSPQQELIACRASQRSDARGTALCVGASIEFLTGHSARAPQWMQRLGLEWSHRLLSNPRRMWRRYLVDGPRIFWLAKRWRPADQ
jgi:N-acetylglucosaminyldiphosphoundecaprenol N-acetyl-beta-D-mannosaminyltransferase